MSKQTETKGKDKVQVGPRFVDHCSYKGRGKGLGLRADARELSRRRWVTQFWGGLLSKLHIFARGTQYCNENMIIYCTHTVRSYCTYYYILPFLLFSISSAVLDDPAFARSWGGGCSCTAVEGRGIPTAAAVRVWNYCRGQNYGNSQVAVWFFSRNFVYLPCDTIHLCNQNPVLQVILDLLLCLCVFVNLCIFISVFLFVYLCT